MGIVLFFLLLVAVAAAIVYPLLLGRTPVATPPAASHLAWTDRQIEGAVQRIRQARQEGGLFCPDCGQAYRAGDAFCVRCGAGLPQPEDQGGGQICPSCGVTLGAEDLFCSRCGHRLDGEEAG